MEMDSKTHLFLRAGLMTNSPGGKRVSQGAQEVSGLAADSNNYNANSLTSLIID